VSGGQQGEVSSDEAREAFYAALLDDDAEELYERAPCGYLSTTPEGTILKANRTFLTLTGYRRDQLIGHRTFVELLTPGGRIYHETHYAPMLAMQGSAREIALDLVRTDGTRLPVLVNAVLERDPTGAPVVVRVAVFDATERREYERELLRAKRRAEELEAHARSLAQTLQATLIPPALPVVPGLDLAAVYHPAGSGAEVGGDFYDVFEIGGDDWAVVIGDVCGKGVEAAVVTALARNTLRAAAIRTPAPSTMLHTLNEVLLRQGTDRFCTVVVVRLRRSDAGWTAVTSCGGHPPPLLSRSGGRPEPFGRYGTLVGILQTPRFHDTELELAPGDTLVLYTDGVTEGRRGLDFFGDERLAASAAAAGGSAASLVDGVLADVLAFQSGDARDDIAVVAVRVPPSLALPG
jgi:sigma-B regulation protein RsbU (phosphoserine phosphatase)